MTREERRAERRAELLWRAWCAFLGALLVVTFFGALSAHADVYSPELSGAPVVQADGGVVVAKRGDAATALPPDTPIADRVQAERARTGFAASAVGLMLLVLRFALGLVKQTAGGAVWKNQQLWVQWVIIAVLSGVIAMLNHWLTGGTWGSALMEMVAAFMLSWTADKVSVIATTNKQLVKRAALDAGTAPPPPLTATSKSP